MRTAYLLIALMLFYTASFAQVQGPIIRGRIDQRVIRVEPRNGNNSRVLDTIPQKAKQHFRVDQIKYQRYLSTIVKDSVKVQKASAKDWDDFELTHKKLQTTLTSNPQGNVRDYIDLNKDFVSLKLVERSKEAITAQFSLRQLIFNINLANSILNNPMTSAAEPKLLSAVINNIDTLCLVYIAPYAMRTLSGPSHLSYPKIAFQVLNKNNVEVKNVTCYLVTPKVCRDISCKTCKVSADPCEQHTIASIISEGDYTFDCANPKTLDVAPGVYHLFVVENNKIIDYQWRTFDANDIQASATPKTVKIILR